MTPIYLPPDRYLDPDPAQRRLALELYDSVTDLALVCPHGHVDPALFADESASFGTPTEMLIIPDHYIFRMLYSQGVPLEALGIPKIDGSPVERDHRRIWQIFAENFHLFQATPSGIWLTQELHDVFGILEKPNSENAQEIYDQIEEKLNHPEYRPRTLFKRFNIEVLCTTDAATDTLEQHRLIRESQWGGVVLPTFRPDSLFQINAPNWKAEIDRLGDLCGFEIGSFAKFIQALEDRRDFFKLMGAKASDQASISAYTHELSAQNVEEIFQRALSGDIDEIDAYVFDAHMLMESARMSVEDGLVMQVHIGSIRNHNRSLFKKFGSDKGADIPEASEFTHNLAPLLNKYGSNPRFQMIVFTLDESTYARELAPLAGHYPCLKIGPPWWFHDSLNGMRRYFDRIVETAGIYNTAGFNDDTRAFPSIPARHDVWRRASANWLAGLLVRHVIDADEANEMMVALTYGLAKKAYRLD